ncbi:hypothetical protein HYV12_01535 [Candidatus Dojkabacteria bacterium]|nr:hypothetical protein [Candidatus Dojkabacteria bacterium]
MPDTFAEISDGGFVCWDDEASGRVTVGMKTGAAVTNAVSFSKHSGETEDRVCLHVEALKVSPAQNMIPAEELVKAYLSGLSDITRRNIAMLLHIAFLESHPETLFAQTLLEIGDGISDYWIQAEARRSRVGLGISK